MQHQGCLYGLKLNLSREEMVNIPRLHSSTGFTLVEVISILVILGVLGAVAVPKYYDLQKEALRKAALAAKDESRARIMMLFSENILQGKGTTSTKATTQCQKAWFSAVQQYLIEDFGKSSDNEFLVRFSTGNDYAKLTPDYVQYQGRDILGEIGPLTGDEWTVTSPCSSL